MEALNGVKKRNFTVEGFQWPFSRVAMEWRPGAGTAKRKKISRDINVATPSPPPLLPHPSSLVSLRQLTHSPPPPPHDPNFLRALQANALRTMSVNGKSFLTNPWSNRAAWSRVQSALSSKKDHGGGGGDLMNKKRQLELWDFAGFSREKLKLLNEIEALIDSEENALNMEASAKAAEGRLRSLLDICVCSQCQENLENRIALQNARSKALEDGKVLSARTNVSTAPALEGPKTTKLPEAVKRESMEKDREKERRFFLGNVKEAMERDRVALDNFLHKQRLKHEVSKKKLDDVKGSFLGKYLSFLDNSQDVSLQKDDLSDRHDQDSEALEDPSKVRKDQTPELERSSEKSDDRTEESITGCARKPADASLSTDAKKLHETIHKLLDKNKQLQEMLSGPENSHDHQRHHGLEHITKLEISCSCKSPWEIRPPRVFNFTRKTSRVLGEFDIGGLEESTGTRTGYEGFPQGYSYLYVSPAFEAENVDPNPQNRSASKNVPANFLKVHKLKKDVIQTQELTPSQEQNFCPKIKLSSLPSLCNSFTQTCDSRRSKQLDLEQPKARPQLEEIKANTDELLLIERQDKVVDAGSSSDETDVSNSVLIDVIRNWRMQVLVPKDLLENKDSCTQTAVSLTDVGQMTVGNPAVEKLTQGDALVELSFLCQEEESKLKALEEIDVKESDNILSNTTQNMLQNFSSHDLIEEYLTQKSASNVEIVESVVGNRSTEELEAAFKKKEEELDSTVGMLSSKLLESQVNVDALEKSLAEKSVKVDEMLEALKTFQAEESQDSCNKIAALEQALADKSFNMTQMSQTLATANSYAEQLRKDFEEAFDDTLRKELATSQETISNLVEETAEKDVKIDEMKLQMEAIQTASAMSRTGLEAKISEERHNAREAYASLESVKRELTNKGRMMEEALAQKNATVQRLELRLKEMENSQSVFEKSQAMLTRQLEGARNSVKEMVQILGTERLNNTEKSVSLEEALNAKNTKIKELELKAQEMQKLKSAMELELKNATENVSLLSLQYRSKPKPRACMPH